MGLSIAILHVSTMPSYHDRSKEVVSVIYAQVWNDDTGDSPVGSMSRSPEVERLITDWAKKNGYEPHDLTGFGIEARGGGSCCPAAIAWIGSRPENVTELRVGDKLPPHVPRQFDRYGWEYDTVLGISGHQISLTGGFQYSWVLDTMFFVDPLARRPLQENNETLGSLKFC